MRVSWKLSFHLTNTMTTFVYQDVYFFASWNDLMLLAVRVLIAVIAFFFNAAAGALIGLSGDRGELVEVIASRLRAQSHTRE